MKDEKENAEQLAKDIYFATIGLANKAGFEIVSYSADPEKVKMQTMEKSTGIRITYQFPAYQWKANNAEKKSI